MKKLLLVFFFTPSLLIAQSRKEKKALELQQKADQQVISNLKNHIQKLTTAQNEANETEYISSQFALAGLHPKGTNGFIQAFKVDDGKKVDAATYLKINDAVLLVNHDYFPLSYSAQKRVTGMPAMALREKGVPWFADIKDWLDDGITPAGSQLDEVIKREVAKVASKGATALFLYNSGSAPDGLAFNKQDKSAPASIPVIYIMSDGYKKYFHDHSDLLDIDVNVAFKENYLAGNNVIGYIDNAARSVIVIGAHYTHPPVKAAGSPETIYGANDNGSGTAMLIELARTLAASKAKNNNYVFIAFGGYDEGLAASNFWLANTSITQPINYMLNLDMVGSYGGNKKLLVQGYNTSPIWKEVLTSIPDKKLEVSIDSIGYITDPHASFYNKGVPVLSFSAATHTDYAAADDEEGKINYAGELQIEKFISSVIEATDSKGKIAFAKITGQHASAPKTLEQQEFDPVKTEATVAPPKTTVSLGVIPDKTGNDGGLKISGVSPKKLASKLGLQPGDVLTSLGTYKIADFRSYMQALSNFKTGDKTTLRIKRGKDDKEFPVEF